MKYKILLVVLFFSVISFSQSYETHNYGEHPQQVYDIYLPDEINDDTKVAIFIHGGGWQALHRQRDYYRSFVRDFFNTAEEYVVINMDYRLVVENGDLYVFPHQIEDMQLTIEDMQSRYNLHNNSVVLFGNSAGGHLAMWYYFNQITPIEKIIPIAAPYDGTIVEGNGRTYFQNDLHPWLQQQIVHPDIATGLSDIIEYGSPRFHTQEGLDNIFFVYMTGDKQHQLTAMQEDFPDIRYQVYDTWHSGWLNRAFRWDLIDQIIDFINTEQEVVEECTVPTNVTLTRISHTTAKFEGANPNFRYQGSANRAGRPLRPYPMYGMNNMTVPHIQTGLVPAFDYDVWLRTICGDGTYSDWTESHYLPRFEGAKTRGNYYNINGVFMGNDFEQLPRGYYIKTNGQESIKIYKK